MDKLAQSTITDCHWMLLRLAGVVPDDLLTQCRSWLGEGRVNEVGRAVTYAAVSHRLSLSAADLGLLGDLRALDGADSSILSTLTPCDIDPLPRYGFAPALALIGDGAGVAADRLPRGIVVGAEPEDDVDAAAVAAARAEPGVRAIWRVWRFPGDDAPWPPPRRLFVAESHGCDPATLASRIQHVLRQAGEDSPQVEVCPVGAQPPSYQRLARANGALLWAAQPPARIRIAAVPDGFAVLTSIAEHPRLAPEEAVRVWEYLSAGQPLLTTTVENSDVTDPSGEPVSMSFFTDGTWVWSEATSAYLYAYHLAPDPELLAQVRRQDYRCRPVDGAAEHRALAELERCLAAREIRVARW